MTDIESLAKKIEASMPPELAQEFHEWRNALKLEFPPTPITNELHYGVMDAVAQVKGSKHHILATKIKFVGEFHSLTPPATDAVIAASEQLAIDPPITNQFIKITAVDPPVVEPMVPAKELSLAQQTIDELLAALNLILDANDEYDRGLACNAAMPIVERIEDASQEPQHKETPDLAD